MRTDYYDYCRSNPASAAIDLENAAAENERLREALEEAAYFLHLKDLDGRWLVDPNDANPDAMKPGIRRIVQALEGQRDE